MRPVPAAGNTADRPSSLTTPIDEKAALASANTRLVSDNAQLQVSTALFTFKCAQLEAGVTKHEDNADSNAEDAGTEVEELEVLRPSNKGPEHENASSEVGTAVGARSLLGHDNQNVYTELSMRQISEGLEEFALSETNLAVHPL